MEGFVEHMGNYIYVCSLMQARRNVYQYVEMFCWSLSYLIPTKSAKRFVE
jgi:hypothetical protein